jgi:hypothetical protein
MEIWDDISIKYLKIHNFLWWLSSKVIWLDQKINGTGIIKGDNNDKNSTSYQYFTVFL